MYLYLIVSLKNFKSFSIEGTSSFYNSFRINYDGNFIMYLDKRVKEFKSFVELKSILEFLENNSEIIRIEVEGKKIEYTNLDKLYKDLSKPLVISYSKFDIYFIDGDYIRLFKNMETRKIEKYFLNSYKNLNYTIKESPRFFNTLTKEAEIDLREILRTCKKEVNKQCQKQ